MSAAPVVLPGAPPRQTGRLLGVSHLVLATRDLDAAERFLCGVGHATYGAFQAPNPLPKAGFVAGPLAPNFSMKLIVSRSGTPGIELLREDDADAYDPLGTPPFEALLASDGALTSVEVLETLARHDNVPFVGFRQVGKPSRTMGVAALVVHSPALETTLPLWRALGYEPRLLNQTLAHVTVRGATPSGHLELFIVADRPRPTTGYLNQAGTVCLSLFCHDADDLSARLSAAGYVSQGCFTITPFTRTLRICFVRNTSGEVYEFLSLLGRERSRDARHA